MKIPILSDSHDDKSTTIKILELLKQKGHKELIFLGDFCAPFMIDLFKDFEVYTCLGNNDGDLFNIMSKMKEYDFEVDNQLLEIKKESLLIALYHGTNQKVLEAIINSKTYDIVLHGHTHQIRQETKGKTLILNPGTINKDLSQENISSYMILDLKTQEVEIVKN